MRRTLAPAHGVAQRARRRDGVAARSGDGIVEHPFVSVVNRVAQVVDALPRHEARRARDRVDDGSGTDEGRVLLAAAVKGEREGHGVGAFARSKSAPHSGAATRIGVEVIVRSRSGDGAACSHLARAIST